MERASGDHHLIGETIGRVPKNVFDNAIDFHARQGMFSTNTNSGQLPVDAFLLGG
jgi:hypothetical protein